MKRQEKIGTVFFLKYKFNIKYTKPQQEVLSFFKQRIRWTQRKTKSVVKKKKRKKSWDKNIEKESSKKLTRCGCVTKRQPTKLRQHVKCK